MSYRSSYQGYQQAGSSNSKNRRRDYDDLGDSSANHHPHHLRSQQHNFSSSTSGGGGGNNNRMQTMEVLSGREYGNEFESEGGGAAEKNRFTIYAGIAFLLLMVMIAPHRDAPDTTSNGNIPNNIDAADAAESDTGDSSSVAEQIITTSPSPAGPISAASPAPSPTIDESGAWPPSRPNFATTCDLPPSVLTDSKNFTFLDRSNFCLSEVSLQ